MDRAVLIREIDRRLGDRQLVWFGTRGKDAEAATDIPQLSGAFSLIATLRGRPSINAGSLEDITGRRVDLDSFDIDDHLRSDAVAELRAALLRALSRPSALFTYRPTTFLSAVGFARQDRCRYLGMFKDHQAAFEHKPWLETIIAGLGVPHIDWRYIADIEQLNVRRLIAKGPVILRKSRTTGGVGVVAVHDVDELVELWPDEEEAFVSVAPFLSSSIPVNVGGVVWRDGTTLHPASLQLIGIEGCTSRPFGYCGNDFGGAADLGDDVLDSVERSSRMIGDELRDRGYVGAFGVDFLIRNGVPLFTEVNPRFQGSTHASCRISIEHGESCLLTEHLGAFLGVPAPASRPLREQARDAELSHIVIHNVSATTRRQDPQRLLDAARRYSAYLAADVLCDGMDVDPGATEARITVAGRVTDSGFELRTPWRAVVDSFRLQ